MKNHTVYELTKTFGLFIVPIFNFNKNTFRRKNYFIDDKEKAILNDLKRQKFLVLNQLIFAGFLERLKGCKASTWRSSWLCAVHL